MTPTYPRNCYLVGSFLVIYAIAAMLLIALIHTRSIHWLDSHNVLRAHLMAAAFGMLGAAISAMRKYYQVLITESTLRSRGQVVVGLDWGLGWLYYYMTRPPLGGILGGLCFTLTQLGFNILKGPISLEISSNGRHIVYGLCFLAGFAASHVLDRFEALAKELFYAPTRDAKD